MLQKLLKIELQHLFATGFLFYRLRHSYAVRSHCAKTQNENTSKTNSKYHSHKKRKDSLETRAEPAVFSL